MQFVGRKIRIVFLVMFLALAAAGVSTVFVSEEVEAAAANGFVNKGGYTYYYKNGVMVKGWVSLNGKKYYFMPGSGRQVQGWFTYNNHKYYFRKHSTPAQRYMFTGWSTSTQGLKRYFDKNGIMATGTKDIGNQRYYFDKTTGAMKTGWLSVGNDRYYFNSSGHMLRNVMYYDKSAKKYRYFLKSGRMIRGWCTFYDNNKRYFSSTPNKLSTDGIMQTGFTKVGSYTFYFASNNGFLMKGWVTRKSDGAKFYFDPNNSGRMVVNKTMTISGVAYVFDKNGVATVKTTVPTATNNARTVKNYLLNALQPIGQCLYVWGGWAHGTTKGVPNDWKTFYSQHAGSSYNFHNYEYQRTKGVDCSGFVGWCAYQVMQSKSGVGSGYTVVSGSVGSTYVSYGWGSIVTQSALAKNNYKIYPGDVGYSSAHTWIMLGQCKDGSCVIVHSTNHGGPQLAGTPTPSGGYNSQAQVLAKKYMAKFPNYNKYISMYKPSTGNYIKNGQFFRWNRATLSDPDGYMNKTADQILADLFKS